MKRETGKHALLYGTKATIERFNKAYPKCTFVRTTINNWKLKMKREKDGKTIFKKKGQPSLVSDDFMKKIKTIIIGTRAAGTFFFLFFILHQYKFLIYKFPNSTMNINSYTN